MQFVVDSLNLFRDLPVSFQHAFMFQCSQPVQFWSSSSDDDGFVVFSFVKYCTTVHPVWMESVSLSSLPEEESVR